VHHGTGRQARETTARSGDTIEATRFGKKVFVLYVIIAYLLLLVSFSQTSYFWPVFTVSMLTLIITACSKQRFLYVRMKMRTFWLAVLSGVLLYSVFALGKWLIVILDLPLLTSLTELYAAVSPATWWHYLVLFLIIIPGEELFWRGFVGAQLGMVPSILLYAGAHVASGSILLVIAALIGGFVWGELYRRTGSLQAAVLSHLVFDLFLLVLFPLL
jgi:membrane protease YdiL (CAAX protease family)